MDAEADCAATSEETAGEAHPKSGCMATLLWGCIVGRLSG